MNVGTNAGSPMDNVAAGAGVLKSILGTTGAVLGSSELSAAAQALGGATGIYKLVNYFQSGMPGGVAGGINAAGGVASIVTALVSVAAKESGSPELQKAAGALSAATGALGLANTAASIAGIVSSMGGVAAAGAAAGTTAAATAGATAGIGVGAGAAFAPIAAALLISTISGLAGGEDPFGEGIGDMIAGVDRYASFPEQVMASAGQQGKGFSVLQNALPYVQNKQELADLVASVNNYVSTTTGIAPELKSGGPFALSAIPGVGPRTHGVATPTVDWGNQTRALQSLLDQYGSVLSGDAPQPTTGISGGLSSDAALRLWYQQLPEAGGLVQGPENRSRPGDSRVWAASEEPTYPWYNPSPESLSKWNPDWKGYGAGDNWGTGPAFDPESRSWVQLNSHGPTPPSLQQYYASSVNPAWTTLTTPGANPVPGTSSFQPNTIAQTGGMRTGVGQTPFGGGAASPLLQQGGASVNSNITGGLQPQTGFVATGSQI